MVVAPSGERVRVSLLGYTLAALGSNFAAQLFHEGFGPARNRSLFSGISPAGLCEVRGGRITEVVGYCSGEWGEELRARHAVEAPMIRP